MPELLQLLFVLSGYTMAFIGFISFIIALTKILYNYFISYPVGNKEDKILSLSVINILTFSLVSFIGAFSLVAIIFIHNFGYVLKNAIIAGVGG